jgi:hypothetical protein
MAATGAACVEGSFCAVWPALVAVGMAAGAAAETRGGSGVGEGTLAVAGASRD